MSPDTPLFHPYSVRICVCAYQGEGVKGMGRCCFIACCWNSCIGPHTTHLMLVKTSLLFISATFYPLFYITSYTMA